MDYKPSELFIGLVDFISVILPGSLFTAILLGIESNHPINEQGLSTYFKGDTSVAFWVAFIFVSFGMGHFLNSIASFLDEPYDSIRKSIFPYKENIIDKIIDETEKYKNKKEEIIKKREIKNITKEQSKEELKLLKKDIEEEYYDIFFKKYRSNKFRKRAHFFFEVDSNVLKNGLKVETSYEIAHLLKEKHLGEINAEATNAYKWSQALLDTYFPAVAEQVNRSMAVSKFFRSLVLVCIIFIIYIIFNFAFSLIFCFPPDSLTKWPLFILSVVLLIFSFREYVVQRQKSVIAAYKGIVSLFYTSENLKIEVKDSFEEKEITSKD